MNPRTETMNTTLMVLGAIILLAVIAWVLTALSQPLVPNTGTATTTGREVTTDPAATTTVVPSSYHQDDSGAIEDPAGQSHTEND